MHSPASSLSRLQSLQPLILEKAINSCWRLKLRSCRIGWAVALPWDARCCMKIGRYWNGNGSRAFGTFAQMEINGNRSRMSQMKPRDALRHAQRAAADTPSDEQATVIGRTKLVTLANSLKSHPYQQQCRGNVRLCRSNIRLCCHKRQQCRTFIVKFWFFRQCQMLLRHCRKNRSTCSVRQRCLDIVAGMDGPYNTV